jgi:hypothetical protein
MAAYTGTPRTWTAGETVTAALMNSDVRDPLAALAGAWTSYTPTVAQGASTDIAKTTSYAKYIRVGKYVLCTVSLSMTGTGTAGSVITTSLPVTAATSGNMVVGSGVYGDAGNATWPCAVFLGSTTAAYLFAANQTAGYVGTTPAVTVASSDIIAFTITYEAA